MPHECQYCNWQCFCKDVPCSCCSDAIENIVWDLPVESSQQEYYKKRILSVIQNKFNERLREEEILKETISIQYNKLEESKQRIKELESANAENMIAYGEEMLKKDKEIEAFQKRIETYEAMINNLTKG